MFFTHNLPYLVDNIHSLQYTGKALFTIKIIAKAHMQYINIFNMILGLCYDLQSDYEA